MRWQSNADSPSVRERFSAPLPVLGIFLSFMLLLALLYPEQGLMNILKRDDIDPATLRYLESVLRVRPDNPALRIRLAKGLVQVGSGGKALEILDGFSDKPGQAERRTVMELRYQALKELMMSARREDPEWQTYQTRFAETVKQLAGADPKEWQLRQYADDARKIGDQETLQAMTDKAKKLGLSLHVSTSATAPDDPAALALACGDYRASAVICFDNMKKTADIARQRELFVRGVRALQAGNMPVEAFIAGERHLNGLANDRETLVFLTRVGLAAGKPKQAEILIKRALKMSLVVAPAGIS